MGFPADLVVKNLPANAADTSLIPVREDPTCHGATKPMSHNCGAHVLQLLKPTDLVPIHCKEKPAHHHKRKHVHNNEDPAQPEINKYSKKPNSQGSRREKLTGPFWMRRLW